MSGLHVPGWWWLGVLFVPLLAGGCKRHEMLCKPTAIFEVLEPQQGAGAAPFSIERLGPEMKMGAVKHRPSSVSFRDEDRLHLEWISFGHMITETDVAYSATEGVARDIDDPKYAFPVKRFSDGKSQRVRLGFRSTVCREPDAHGGYWFCEPSEDQAFLVADLTCQPDNRPATAAEARRVMQEGRRY